MSKENGRSTSFSFTHPPRRVVSLVPSITESLFDLGAGGSLVGVTDYCEPPEGSAAGWVRVGGTKSPDVEAIVRLKPELVIANMEENSRESVEALEAAGVRVWVTFPRSVAEALSVLGALVRLFHLREGATQLKTLEMTLEWNARAIQAQPAISVFCPIWQETHDTVGVWWMTFNQDTYCGDLLKQCGGENIFADRERRHPLAADLGLQPAEDPADRDTRYPRVSVAEVAAAAPEVILLPSEPFPFSLEHVEQVAALLPEAPAVRNGCVHTVDGRLLTWHGTRLAGALAEIPSLLHPTGRAPGA